MQNLNSEIAQMVATNRFHLFGQLPAELRHEIWRESMERGPVVISIEGTSDELNKPAYSTSVTTKGSIIPAAAQSCAEAYDVFKSANPLIKFFGRSVRAKASDCVLHLSGTVFKNPGVSIRDLVMDYKLRRVAISNELGDHRIHLNLIRFLKSEKCHSIQFVLFLRSQAPQPPRRARALILEASMPEGAHLGNIIDSKRHLIYNFKEWPKPPEIRLLPVIMSTSRPARPVRATGPATDV
ncbi:uncharacterized protein CTRU02_212648 [Colletotrichum truncatum]|uniref:Uncharacterized protein n=1 Tax=Colletotrichum truncatum TaxID=5467 RepID=A0ACC3YIH6_COLTU|nr:uncharacterized protein CTRU02_05280 [Colletotrichum truncatum]KAF6794448.1 hypothetical protein CTRU02_05280 [Colletotrichum truncatum]